MLKRHLFTTLTALLALIGSATTTNIAYADPSVPASQDPETVTLASDLPPLSVDGVGGYSEEEVAEMQEFFRTVEQNIDETTAQETLTPGEMWSDSIELPDAVDKEDADQAELMIAEEQESGVASRWQSRAPRCRIFWPSPHRVCGAILQAYEQLGGMTSWLLFPIEAESINPDLQGYRQRFANGFIYWHPNTGGTPCEHPCLINLEQPRLGNWNARLSYFFRDSPDRRISNFSTFPAWGCITHSGRSICHVQRCLQNLGAPRRRTRPTWLPTRLTQRNHLP